MPTASAVVADIIDICRLLDADSETRVPLLGFQSDKVQAQNFLSIDEITSSYYLRMYTQDQAGVLAAVAAVLAKYDISIEALIQKSVLDSTHAEIVILTHSTIEKNIKAAIAEIEAQETVAAPVVMIRMESLHG